MLCKFSKTKRPETTSSPVKKIIAGLLAVVTLALLLCSCGKKEDSIVGEWRFDILHSDLSGEDLLTLASKSSNADILRRAVDLLGDNFLKESMDAVFQSYTLSFDKDGTLTLLIDPALLRQGTVAMYDNLFDSFAKLSPDAVAGFYGVSAAELKARLEAQGKTFAELCEEGKAEFRQNVNTTMTDQALAKNFNATLNKDGKLEVAKEEYVLEDNQLSFVNASKQKTGAWTITCKDDVITVGKVVTESNSASASAFFEGMKLVKVGS